MKASARPGCPARRAALAAHAASSGQCTSRVPRIEDCNARIPRPGQRGPARATAGLGPRARIFPDRHRRHRSRHRRSPAARMAGQRISRRDGLHGGARPEAGPAGRARAGHALGRDRTARLPAARHPVRLAGARMARLGRRSRRRSRSCPRPRLSQGGAGPPAAARRSPGRCDRPVRPSRSSRFGTGASRSSWRRAAASAGAASTPSPSTAKAARCSSSARSTSTWPAADAAGRGALRQLQRLHRHLPDPGDRRPVPARRAALHLLPDDRAEGRDSGGVPSRHRQPHLRLRRLPAHLSVEQVRAAQPLADFDARAALAAPSPARALGLGRSRVPAP